MKNKHDSNRYQINSSINNDDIIDLTYDQDLSDLELPKKIKQSIKSKTLKELSLKPKVKPKSVFRVSIAALLAAFALFVATTPSAMASIKSVIQYIPGFNILLESDSPTFERYILEQPVTKITKDKKIEVIGAMVDSESTSIYLSLTDKDLALKDLSVVAHDRYLKDMYIKDAKGFKYKYFGGSYSVGYRLSGKFKFQGRVRYPESLEIVFPCNNDFSVTINLKKADNNSYTELGPSDNKNDINVTAIVKDKDDRTYINLLCPQDDTCQIKTFGIESDLIKVTDEYNNEYKLSYIKPKFGTQSEFYIENKDLKGKSLSVTVPEIEFSYNRLKMDKFEIDIPSGNSAELNKRIEIAGHKLLLTKVEKIEDNKIRVFVDINKNENVKEYLSAFSFNEAFMYSFSGKSHLLEYFEIKYNPGEKTKVLNVNNIEIVKKGPWILKINK